MSAVIFGSDDDYGKFTHYINQIKASSLEVSIFDGSNVDGGVGSGVETINEDEINIDSDTSSDSDSDSGSSLLDLIENNDDVTGGKSHSKKKSGRSAKSKKKHTIKKPIVVVVDHKHASATTVDPMLRKLFEEKSAKFDKFKKLNTNRMHDIANKYGGGIDDCIDKYDSYVDGSGYDDESSEELHSGSETE